MSNNTIRRHIVCYDITDPKRLQRIHRRVQKDGIALQRSVFDCHLNDSQLNQLKADLRSLMDERHDDVRIYGPHQNVPELWLGTSPYADGVMLFDNTPTQRTPSHTPHALRYPPPVILL